MRVEILGRERRRRWRDDEKLAIVVSVGVAGATITEVAHRHDVTRQQIYTWRSELKKKGLLSPSENSLFIPVDMNAVKTNEFEDRAICSGVIELRLSCGRSLHFDSAVDGASLTRVVVWHLIVRMRPFRPMMAPNLRLLGAIFRLGRLLVGQ